MAETTTPKKRGRKAAAAGQPVTQEVVVMVPLAELHPFPDHPFQVRDDESMRETAASVKENGVIIPGLVRPREEGGYEIIAGHRRKHACELAGLTAMPVIVRDMDRDSATVVMVDSNLQRESILPSERAKAYKMKLDAIKRLAGRPAKTNRKMRRMFRRISAATMKSARRPVLAVTPSVTTSLSRSWSRSFRRWWTIRKSP